MGNYCQSICEKKVVEDEFVNDRERQPINLATQSNTAVIFTRKDRMESPIIAPQTRSMEQIQSHGPDLSTGSFVQPPLLSIPIISTLNTLSNPSRIPPQPKPFRSNSTSQTYHGQWRNNQPHGYGRTYFPDGSIFEGEYMDGVPIGQGRYIDEKGYYQGEVKAGRANGKGKYVREGYRYDGGWRDDRRDGEGVEEKERGVDGGEEQGYLFEGVFERGRKVKGNLSWRGGKYNGEFQNDQFNGNGTLTVDDGVYKGDFVDGMYHGQGEYKWNDGAVYQGQYDNGVKQGFGKYWSADKLYFYQGNWLDGLQHGGGKATYKDTQIQGKWQKGHLTQQF